MAPSATTATTDATNTPIWVYAALPVVSASDTPAAEAGLGISTTAVPAANAMR